MKKFDLNIYKDFKQYFNILDVLIKLEFSNKELFLEEVDVSPSSYRRAKKEGNKIGEIILDKLSKYFKYNLCSNELIDEIETRINKIYYDIYYKYYDDYEEHYKWLDEMISKKYIIFPIFKLFKLLMKINDDDNPISILSENINSYNEIKQYESFFKGELFQIIEIFDVLFKKEIDDYFLTKNFTSELTYHILASKCLILRRHIESLYFSNKAKEKYIKDENYKRVYFINTIIIANYNYLFKFQDAYTLSEKQLRNLQSINNKGIEYEHTYGLYNISCVGLKKYKELIERLEAKDSTTYTETLILFVALYNTNIDKYNDLKEEYLTDTDDNKIIQFINIIDEFLKTNNKKKVVELEPYYINKSLIEILKKM